MIMGHMLINLPNNDGSDVVQTEGIPVLPPKQESRSVLVDNTVSTKVSTIGPTNLPTYAGGVRKKTNIRTYTGSIRRNMNARMISTKEQSLEATNTCAVSWADAVRGRE